MLRLDERMLGLFVRFGWDDRLASTPVFDRELDWTRKGGVAVLALLPYRHHGGLTALPFAARGHRRPHGGLINSVKQQPGPRLRKRDEPLVPHGQPPKTFLENLLAGIMRPVVWTPAFKALWAGSPTLCLTLQHMVICRKPTNIEDE